jgi:hypothetical protein
MGAKKREKKEQTDYMERIRTRTAKYGVTVATLQQDRERR